MSGPFMRTVWRGKGRINSVTRRRHGSMEVSTGRLSVPINEDDVMTLCVQAEWPVAPAPARDLIDGGEFEVVLRVPS